MNSMALDLRGATAKVMPPFSVLPTILCLVKTSVLLGGGYGIALLVGIKFGGCEEGAVQIQNLSSLLKWLWLGLTSSPSPAPTM